MVLFSAASSSPMILQSLRIRLAAQRSCSHCVREQEWSGTIVPLVSGQDRPAELGDIVGEGRPFQLGVQYRTYTHVQRSDSDVSVHSATTTCLWDPLDQGFLRWECNIQYPKDLVDMSSTDCCSQTRTHYDHDPVAQPNRQQGRHQADPCSGSLML